MTWRWERVNEIDRDHRNQLWSLAVIGASKSMPLLIAGWAVPVAGTDAYQQVVASLGVN